MNDEVILITGGLGQIGSDLSEALVKKFGKENVLVTDLRDKPKDFPYQYEQLDVLDQPRIEALIEQYNITTVYHLAAMLSATSEKVPIKAWDLNTQSLLYFLELAKEGGFCKIFWPSSIAVFGEDAPKNMTPQNAALNPSSVYGISKVAGELWCKYYFDQHGVDVRSVRYPGLISWKSKPGGGTTDYAVDIYHQAIEQGVYHCYLSADTYLPMMYMEDAIDATIALMSTEKENIHIRNSYNLGGMSFSPKEIAASIQKEIPDFKIDYHDDFRQKIADSWPNSIDDSAFKKDVPFQEKYNLDKMTRLMLEKLSIKAS